MNEYTIKDSFSFAEELLNYDSNLIMASFDVESLFTNIPLQETIDLCVKLLFNDKSNIDGFTITDFHQLLTITMSESLDLLVKNLLNNDFKYLSEEFSSELLVLVKEKGVYPYEYMNNFKKISEDKLPDKCEFFNSLKDGCISEKDYKRANNVWNTFKMKTMSDYHDLYLKTDVLLLTDVFAKFIKTCLDCYG